MRPRVFHRTDTRVSFGFEIPLPHECTRVGGTKTAVVGIDRERIYPTKCVPFGSTDTFHNEEVWYDVYVHRLP